MGVDETRPGLDTILMSSPRSLYIDLVFKDRFR